MTAQVIQFPAQWRVRPPPMLLEVDQRIGMVGFAQCLVAGGYTMRLYDHGSLRLELIELDAYNPGARQ